MGVRGAFAVFLERRPAGVVVEGCSEDEENEGHADEKGEVEPHDSG